MKTCYNCGENLDLGGIVSGVSVFMECGGREERGSCNLVVGSECVLDTDIDIIKALSEKFGNKNWVGRPILCDECVVDIAKMCNNDIVI